MLYRGRHSLYKSMGMLNIQYLKSNIDIRCTNIMWMSNIQFTPTLCFTRRTTQYKPMGMSNMNVYPISMYRVNIHCTNLWEFPIKSKKQHRYSLYKRFVWMSNIHYQTNCHLLPLSNKLNSVVLLVKQDKTFDLHRQWAKPPNLDFTKSLSV